MGFLKSLAATGSSFATGGLYSTGGNGLLQGGGLAGYAENSGLGLLKSASGNKDESDPNAGLDIYNQGLSNQGRNLAAQKKKDYYGDSLNNLGAETTNYTDRIKGNLDKNVAKADLYNQQAGTQRSLDNARAGLSGVDTSAMNEQGRRNASFGAASINEDAKRQALDMYGTSISNRIEGANKIDNSEMALAIAQMKQPQTNYKPGLIGSIFSGFA